ncbi:MAG: DUF4760 domain-containing protein, partial [Bacteroidia bacterium]
NIITLTIGVIALLLLFRQINSLSDVPSARIDLYIKTISGFLVAFSALFAASTYYRNGRLERAKWLNTLHEKFFIENKFSEIRRLLDYKEPSDLYSSLAASFPNRNDKNNIDLEEKLVDYLNFFEFIATLNKQGQLSQSEINSTFGYYISKLNSHKWLIESLKTHEFKNLPSLIEEINQLKNE